MSVEQIDEIDKIILKRLFEDARTNFSDIAKECSVSVTAICKRFKKMQSQGIINGTALFVDLSDTQDFALAITIDLTLQEKEKRVIEAIKKLPTIIGIIPVIGNHDFIVVAHARGIQEINKIKEKIKKINGVKEITITANLDKKFFFLENLLK